LARNVARVVAREGMAQPVGRLEVTADGPTRDSKIYSRWVA